MKAAAERIGTAAFVRRSNRGLRLQLKNPKCSTDQLRRGKIKMSRKFSLRLD